MTTQKEKDLEAARAYADDKYKAEVKAYIAVDGFIAGAKYEKERRIAEVKTLLSKTANGMQLKELDDEIVKLVNDHFWSLLK